MKEISEKEILARMASYCATGERCRQDVLDKLKKWELTDVSKEKIITFLLTERYIDEERYCRSFVNDKIRFSKWGKKKTAQALWQKNIPERLAAQALDEFDEEEYLAVLRQVLESKQKSIRAESEYEFKGKLMRFALSRGFEADLIDKVYTSLRICK